MNSKVSIVKCANYDREKVIKAVEYSVDLIGGIDKYIKSGAKVLIKPNLLSPRSPERGKTTHPEIVRAVIRLVRKVGAIPYVGDSPGGNIVTTQTRTTFANIEKYWIETGMKKVCDEEKVDLISFETGGVEIFKIKNRKYTPEVIISKVVFSYDVIINVPKLKTHNLVLFTGAIKNLYGCVPGVRKTEYHKKAINPTNFSQLLVDIFSIIKPQLCIMDAIVGMDGQGPSAGRLVNIGAILASNDMVAIDSVSCRIFGYKPDDIPTNKIAYLQGLGEMNLNKIEILGEKLENIFYKNPKRPSNAIVRNIPQFIIDILGKFVWVRPKINTEKCTICKICVNNCPMKTIVIKNKYPVIEYKNCINCMCCHELCNYEAIDIEMSWVASKLVNR